MTAAAPRMKRLDAAYVEGNLPLADAMASALLGTGYTHLAEGIEQALIRYRSREAGTGCREYPQDLRAAANLELARALGVEMSAVQRAKMYGAVRTEEIAAHVEGLHKDGGYTRHAAIETTARRMGLSIEEVKAALEHLYMPAGRTTSVGRGDTCGIDMAAPDVAMPGIGGCDEP